MYQTTFVTLAALLCSLLLADGGKVLVVPIGGSHWLNMNIIIQELHSRGHEITVLLTNMWDIKLESTPFKTISINSSFSFEKKAKSMVATQMKLSMERESLFTAISIFALVMRETNHLHKLTVQVMGEVFENTKLMQSLHDAKYDLLLTDPVFGEGVLLGHRLGLPLVFNGHHSFWGDGHFAVAPSPPSFIPVTANLTDQMDFTQRVINFLNYIIKFIYTWYCVELNYQPFVQRYFDNVRHYSELFQTAEIWLMRTGLTFDFPRPTMPNIIYVPGFHCKPPKPLSKELEDFVQSSGEHGVIVMALGTQLEIPEAITEDIAAAFAELPQKVIWSKKGKRPSTLGNNTLLLDWMPQNDLLGHPKTRVFVTHGGANGLQEAVYHSVPLVGLPLVNDQPRNLFIMKVKGVAKVQDFVTLNKHDFLEALKEVLHESSYRENMKILSNLHRDQLTKPLDRAIFWIEFVMRHKGAPHLKTESFKMSTIQYYSIDVMTFLVAVSSSVCIATYLAVKFLWQRVFSKSKVKKE